MKAAEAAPSRLDAANVLLLLLPAVVVKEQRKEAALFPRGHGWRWLQTSCWLPLTQERPPSWAPVSAPATAWCAPPSSRYTWAGRAGGRCVRTALSAAWLSLAARQVASDGSEMAPPWRRKQGSWHHWPDVFTLEIEMCHNVTFRCTSPYSTSLWPVWLEMDFRSCRGAVSSKCTQGWFGKSRENARGETLHGGPIHAHVSRESRSVCQSCH